MNINATFITEKIVCGYGYDADYKTKRVVFLSTLSHTQTSLRQNAEVDWGRYRGKSGRGSEASCSSEVPGLLSSTRDTNFHGSYFGAL